jgi:hypothetical protein
VRLNPNDVVLTNRSIAKKIIEYFNPQGLCLDPCKGKGAFYDYMSHPKEYCEIQENIDFFTYLKSVDWIISNPPYSNYDNFLLHSFEIAKNIVYLIPLSKIFRGKVIQEKAEHYGNIKTILIIGTGNELNFPMGFMCGCVHYEKEYNGLCKIERLDIKQKEKLFK